MLIYQAVMKSLNKQWLWLSGTTSLQMMMTLIHDIMVNIKVDMINDAFTDWYYYECIMYIH